MQISRQLLIDMLPPNPTPEMERLNVAPQSDDVLNFVPLSEQVLVQLGLAASGNGAPTAQGTLEDDDFSLDVEAIQFD